MGTTTTKKKKKDDDAKHGGSISALLYNPSMWWLNIACALVLAVKVALGDLIVLWLVEERGYTGAAAGGVVFWLEVGFGAGSLTCGWLSDKFCGGSRSLVNLVAQGAATAALAILFLGPPPAPSLTVPALVFLVGAGINMPATLIGMVASEKVPPSLAATACGIVGGVGYLGASLCGYPLGNLVVVYGWEFARIVLVCVSGLGALALLPLYWSDLPSTNKTQ